MLIARIEDETVIETVTLPDGAYPADCFHPDLEWVTAPANQGIKAGWRYEEGEWISPPAEPEPTLDDRRADAVTMIKAAAFERIEAAMPAWMAVRAVSGGPAVAEAVQSEAERLRAASDELEAQAATMETEALAAFDPAADEHWAG